jgi:hypothetical protein
MVRHQVLQLLGGRDRLSSGLSSAQAFIEQSFVFPHRPTHRRRTDLWPQSSSQVVVHREPLPIALVTPFLGTIDPDTFSGFRSRVAAGLKTTFASSYTSEGSLAEMLDPLVFRRYAKQATGEKYLVVPNLDDM